MIDTIPNRITAGRFVLTVVLYVLLAVLDKVDSDPQVQGHSLAVASFVVFVIAALSDFLDGYVARQMGQVTPLGRILDPFVDKLLVCGAMVFLASNARTRQFLPAWIVVVVLLREFFVTGLRGIIEFQGSTFPADLFGKIKMGFQCFAVAAILFHRAWGGVGLQLEPGAENELTASAAHALVWATLVSTVVSGVIYAFKARGKIVLERLP